jgi:peptidoglycan/LPS O-acetylase OafA/YrhL
MVSWPPPGAQQFSTRVPYLAGLDGLRAVAVVAVMLYHADKTWLQGGFLGVEVFFVISGYLITLLLITEHQQAGRVDLKRFWIRRFRRLLPALLVMIAVLAVYVALFYRRAQGQVRGDIVGGLSYLSNWYQIIVGAGYTAQEAFAPLRHLWSLAVEEQFYVLWPLVMLLILRRGRERLPKMGVWLIGVAVAITVLTALLFVPGDINSTCLDGERGYWRVFGRCISINDTLYLSTFSRASGLMLGAAFAMVWRPHALLRGPVRTKGRQLDLVALLGLCLLGLLVWNTHLAEPAESLLTGSRFDPVLFRGGFLLTAIATVCIIAAVTHPRARAGRLLGNPLFRWIGTRSYGLYLYHWPIYQIIRKEAGLALSVSQFVLAMAITVPLTEASYRLVERPIREGRLGAWVRSGLRSRSRRVAIARRRLAIAGLASVAMLSFATVSIAMSPVRCLGDVACANEAGQDAVADSQIFDITGGALDTFDPSTTPIAAPTTTPPDSAITESSGASVPSTDTTPNTIGRTPEGIPATPPEVATTVAPTGDTTPPATNAVDAPSPTPSSSAPAAPPQSAPATTTVPATAPPTAPPPTTVPPPPPDQINRDLLPTIALGESVMLGAATQLTAGGVLTDAEVGRGPDKMGDIVQWLHANNRIGRIIVLQVGTNGPVTQAQYDRLMSFLPAAEVTVVFLTVKAPKSWIAGNNALIRALPQQYPNVRVVDWEAEAAAIEGELSRSDGGVHLRTSTAKQFYANLIFNGMGRPDLVR